MKKIIIAVLAISLFTGCAHLTKDEKAEQAASKETVTKVVTEYKYVVRTATKAQKTLPNYASPLDVSKSTQLDLATWITKNEERQLRLEAIIKELIDFYEQTVTNLELTAAEQLEAKKLEAK